VLLKQTIRGYEERKRQQYKAVTTLHHLEQEGESRRIHHTSNDNAKRTSSEMGDGNIMEKRRGVKHERRSHQKAEDKHAFSQILITDRWFRRELYQQDLSRKHW